MIFGFLAIFGVALGSFVNALVWRLHEQEIEAKKQPSPKRKVYLKQLSIINGRSMCPHCHHQLATKDLIPVLSWLQLRGKCLYCHKTISWQYPLVEVLTATLFVLSYLYWPLSFHGIGVFEFVVWLILLVGFIALAVYDLKWFMLPNRIVYPLFALAILQLAIICVHSLSAQPLWGAFWGLLIGGGLFYAIFQVSNGKWIGGGDVKLGSLLGVLIGGPLASGMLLFVASLSGTLVSVPLLLSGKFKRNAQIPFGPFLLFSAYFMRLFGASVISWLQQRALLP